MSKSKNMVLLPVAIALIIGLAGGYWYALSTKQQPDETSLKMEAKSDLKSIIEEERPYL